MEILTATFPKEWHDKKTKFGKHKGKKWSEIPKDYARWVISNEFKHYLKLKIYLQEVFNYPRKLFRVTVKDSVGDDGIYYIEGYHKKQIYSFMFKRITCTQSYHGTTVEAEECTPFDQRTYTHKELIKLCHSAFSEGINHCTMPGRTFEYWQEQNFKL